MQVRELGAAAGEFRGVERGRHGQRSGAGAGSVENAHVGVVGRIGGEVIVFLVVCYLHGKNAGMVETR